MAAEGLPSIPEDTSERPDEQFLPPRRRIEIPNFMDSFLKAEKPEDEESDEEDSSAETVEKPRPFRDALKKFFSTKVDREDVAAPERDRGSIAFGGDAENHPVEQSDVNMTPEYSEVVPEQVVDRDPDYATEPVPVAEQVPDTTDTEPVNQTEAPVVVSTPDLAPIETTPSTEVVEPLEPLVTHEAAAPVETVDLNTTTVPTEILHTDATTTPEAVYIEDRRMSPESALLFAGLGYEHHRVSKLKNRERALEHDVKNADREIDKNKEVTKDLRREIQQQRVERQAVVPPRPEVAPTNRFERPEKQELRAEKAPEQKRTITSETTREQQRTAVEQAVERHSAELSKEKKQEIIEHILDAPDFKGALNAEVEKDITYELSHEHKDMDKQSQSAWAALQMAADATAKANVQAFATAASLISTGAATDELKKAAAAQKAQANTQSMYKKAALSGFITAVFIAALLLVILLVQRK